MPSDLIQPDWVCYCAGVGEQIRFELALMEKKGVHVFGFDPTPRAIQFVERIDPPLPNFTLVPKGLWKEDITMRFFAPEKPDHVSHSIVEDDEGRAYFEAPCVTVATAMKELGHDRLDLLKMNIEGAEDKVLESLEAANIFPTVVALTYEGHRPLAKARRWTKRLAKHGYQVAGADGWAVTYIRSPDHAG
ncbi:MAG: FkbM family methyltransferase [Phycisphaeraceae bacterium]